MPKNSFSDYECIYYIMYIYIAFNKNYRNLPEVSISNIHK